MEKIVFGLNALEAYVFLTILALFILAVIVFVVVLSCKLHNARCTIAELREKATRISTQRLTILREYYQQMSDTNEELIKGIAKQTNIKIKNYR